MLRIKTYLHRATIHGIGLFADEEIMTDELVWELNHLVDHTYILDQWNAIRTSISVQSFSNIRRLSYKEENLIYICMDNAQFMNHSEALYNVAHHGSFKNRMYAVRQTYFQGRGIVMQLSFIQRP